MKLLILILFHHVYFLAVCSEIVVERQNHQLVTRSKKADECASGQGNRKANDSFSCLNCLYTTPPQNSFSFGLLLTEYFEKNESENGICEKSVWQPPEMFLTPNFKT